MLNAQHSSYYYVIANGIIVATIIICTVSSVFCEFSNIKTLRQFSKLGSKHSLHFSIGQYHEHLRYFFELTLWHLWFAGIIYIILWDMLIKQLFFRDKKNSSAQNVITRLLSTFALGVGFIYWPMFGVPRVLAKQATAFNLINTFGLHFLILIAVLTYYFMRNKLNLIRQLNNEKRKSACIDINEKKIALNEMRWAYYLIFFYSAATVFAALSYVLQFYLTARVPVYDHIIDWRHPFIAVGACLGAPLIFSSIFFIMHMENKYTQFLRGIIITSITASMAFTMSYGFFDNCFHYTAVSAWIISLSITILSSGCAYKFYSFHKKENFEILFPPIQKVNHLHRMPTAG